MPGAEPTTEKLRRQQLAQEQAELDELARAQSPADADAHLRRAEKASYLREKLEQQQRADRQADTDHADANHSDDE